MNDLTNLNYRGTAMQTSALALNTFLQHGTSSCWGTHRIGVTLTAKYGMDHAETLVVIQPWLWRRFFDIKKYKLAQMATRVWGYQGGGSIDELAKFSISKTEEFAKMLKLGLKISDYIKEKNQQSAIDDIAERTWSLMNFKPFGESGIIKKDDIKEIVGAAF